MHVMVEGIDGCGKDSFIQFLLRPSKLKRKKIFDVVSYTKEKNTLPAFEDFKDFDVIVTCEPTYANHGKKIREEIIKDNGRHYSAEETAIEYSLDRLEHYQKIILPAKKAGKVVLQGRGAPSSFCYQPIQAENYPLEKIIRLPGNVLALGEQPDILFILKAEPEIAMKRLNKRYDKKDDVIFEKLDFLKKLQPRYESSEILPKLFDKSKIIYVDTNDKNMEDMMREGTKYYTQIFGYR